MRSSVIAFFLSVCTVAAAAQCVANPAAAPTANAPVSATPVAAGRSPAAVRPVAARPAPELIATAAAVTHDGAPVAQSSPVRNKGDSGERPRRTGSAMLLAALALMSGIALRRYSARNP